MKKIAILMLALFLTLHSNISKCKTFDKITIFGCSELQTEHILLINNFIKKEGYEYPKYFTCDRKMAKRIYKKRDFNKVEGFFIHSPREDDTDLIYLNPKARNEDYTLIHELGHYNSYILLGKDIFDECSTLQIPENLKSEIDKRLGSYATTNRGEFVAEYFALSHMGMKFPKELTDFYFENGGI